MDIEARSGWGRLPRPVLVLRCGRARCGYATHPDGRVETVIREHYANCALAYPEDALLKLSGDSGPEMLVPLRERLGP